jgi:hypothetical protein
MTPDIIIAQTKKWILDVVIGCNFCPFAAREVKRDSIVYEVAAYTQPKIILQKLSAAFLRMNGDDSVETLLLILPNGFASFAVYLKLVSAANTLIKKNGYEGIYQLASFHPSYLFAGSKPSDAANYTNRSPYPVLQILRESSVSRAVDSYPDTLKIPERNMDFARQKGLAFMQTLFEESRKSMTK